MNRLRKVMPRQHGDSAAPAWVSSSRNPYVELMGGTISVDSIPEVGTKITFAAVFEVPESAKPVDKALLAHKRVLIVESDTAKQRLFENYTRDWEMTAVTASDTVSAFSLAREASTRGEPFDFAIISHALPESDGLALGHQFKNDTHLASVHLMLIASDDEPGLAESARACGFEAYLTKPIVQSHVYDRLVAMQNAGGRTSTPAKRAASTPVVTSGSTKHILLVEDNAVNVQVATRQLLYIGCQVTSVDNGKAAVEILERQHFDIVLMDCNMPIMDGYTAARHIRKDEVAQRRHRTPIIAMTANASEADRQRCIGAGMDDFISKPVVIEALKEVRRSNRTCSGGRRNAGCLGTYMHTILVVDDARVNVEVYERILAKLEESKIVGFTSSKLAMTWLLDNKPDLVITDFRMPDLDGLQLIEQFRTQPTSKGVPIIMITSSKEKEIRHKALELGVDDFLEKPADPVAFLTRSRNLLKLREQSLATRESDGLACKRSPACNGRHHQARARDDLHADACDRTPRQRDEEPHRSDGTLRARSGTRARNALRLSGLDPACSTDARRRQSRHSGSHSA